MVGGTLAPLLLAVVFVSLTLHERSYLRALGWSAVHRSPVEWPSVLETGPLGWIEAAAFVASALLGVAYALALGDLLSGRLPRAGALALGLMSVAVGFMAFKPDPAGARHASTSSAIHNGVYPVIPVAALAAAACFAAGLRHSACWRREALLSAAFLIVGALALSLTSVDSIAQLARYFFFGPLLLWSEMVALGAFRNARRVSPAERRSRPFRE